MKRLDSDPLVNSEPASSKRIPKLESVLRSEVGQAVERELELPTDTLLTITAVQVLPDLSQARIGVSILPTEKADKIFKTLISIAGVIQRSVNERLKLYRVPRLNFYIDNSLEQADKIDHLLDSLRPEM